MSPRNHRLKDKRKGFSKYLPYFLAIIFTLAIFLILTLPLSLRQAPSLLNIGDVAFQDIRAPRSFSYVSDLLTESAKDDAEKSVSPVYLPADPSISRKQIEKMKNTLNYIANIRNDEFSDRAQKLEDISHIDEISLSPVTQENILALSEEKWAAIQSESLYLLEQGLRTTIREDQITSSQRNLSAQIGFEFSESESTIINELVAPMITANSLFSSEKTNEAILIARENTPEITRNYAAGEIIISSGEVINALTWEALQELGYTEPQNKILDFLSAGLLSTTIVIFLFLYIRRVRKTSGQKISGVFYIAILFLFFLTAARIVIPNHTILPYLFPVAAFGLTLASIYGYEVGLIGSLALSVLAAYDQSNTVDLAIYYFLPSAISIFVLGRGRRMTVFFLAGLALTMSGSALIIAYRILNSYIDFTGVSTLIGASVVNGIGSVSLSLIFQFIISQLLGKTTALQLMDLSRPDHPLLQQLLVNAPGTYQHSLQLSNLAEQAARDVNGDALLTRVGALYHDVGKSLNPQFFVENQPPGNINTHEELDPVIASATIIQHVTDGIKLAKKHRIPPEVQSFILEHHGTTITRYQYSLAIQEAGDKNEVHKDLFRYPGPTPQSKETAILMIADGCEARMRSEMPDSIEDIRNIVQDSVDYYLSHKQLDFADLTLRDLQSIIRSFSKTFMNTYHHRIKYPEQLEENKAKNE